MLKVFQYYKNLAWLLLSFFVIMLDQVSKYLAEKYLIFQDPVVVIKPVFNLMLDFNRGAAFSFLKNAGGFQIIFFIWMAIIISILLIFWLMRLPYGQHKLLAAGLALVIGGAIGNVIDRIRYGYVTDFISWHIKNYYWPTFNLADTAVCIGVFLMIIRIGREDS